MRRKTSSARSETESLRAGGGRGGWRVAEKLGSEETPNAGRQNRMRRTIYLIVALDLVIVLCTAILYGFTNSPLLLEGALPVLLVINLTFLRGGRRAGEPRAEAPASGTRNRTFWLYGGAGIFTGGALYGLALFSSGQLPLALLPVLLFPLSLACYFLWAARSG